MTLVGCGPITGFGELTIGATRGTDTFGAEGATEKNDAFGEVVVVPVPAPMAYGAPLLEGVFVEDPP